jgi:tRNA G18 (ribose-2'-O)-methylase SpoU
MSDLAQQRHRPPSKLVRPRELVVACPPMRSNVNLSRIVRVASCCGVRRLIACGPVKIDPKIARDGAAQIAIELHRTLAPALKKMKADGYRLVGLEQTNRSVNLHAYRFVRRSVLIVGHERLGLGEDVLRLLDHAVEIPVYGLPFSYNVATAAAMALYEYCRQFPRG